MFRPIGFAGCAGLVECEGYLIMKSPSQGQDEDDKSDQAVQPIAFFNDEEEH